MTVLAFTQLRTPADGVAASIADTRAGPSAAPTGSAGGRHRRIRSVQAVADHSRDGRDPVQTTLLMSASVVLLKGLPADRSAARGRVRAQSAGRIRCASRQLVQVRRKADGTGRSRRFPPKPAAWCRPAWPGRPGVGLWLGVRVRHRWNQAAGEHAVLLEPAGRRRRYSHAGDAAGIPEAASEYRPGRGGAGVGQPLLHEGLAGHARATATGRRDLAPDPGVDPGAGRPAGAAERKRARPVRAHRRQFHAYGVEHGAHERDPVRDPARYAPAGDVLQHRHLQEGRAARQGRQPEEPR